MRIVAVADTHLFTDDFIVPDGDVFVHAGDMCQAGTIAELLAVVTWLADLPHRHKVIIAGNHDWSFIDARNDARALVAAVHYLQDQALELDGVRFYGSPWQPEFGGWAFNLPRGPQIAERWNLIPPGLDVLITHGPPAGFGDRTPRGGRVGCADLLQRIDVVRPRLHLFGHIHEDGGVWTHGDTTFANVTTWECERGATVIDLDAAGVHPVLVPPHGRRDEA